MNVGDSYKLEIKGLGHIVSFKNTKQIAFNRKTKRNFIMTNPRKKEQMEGIIRSFVSQLRGAFPIAERGTDGEWPKPSQIASFAPLDDSLDWTLPGEQHLERVQKGEEGAIIKVERIA